MTADRTDDGRYVVIDGRRWRATDPRIPEPLRKQLVTELMRARRLVKTDGDSARHRVQDAKVALGERGQPWWEPREEDAARERLAATICALLRERNPSTICPSDAARVAGGDSWRDLMDAARSVAADLEHSGHVVITQKGEPVDVETARGPIRIAPGPDLEQPRPTT
ncbi:DUF3253 domain-containing protein [Rhodococcus sp. B50]|uniref:DUF3253 domain-containing protein n=1 Tax=Rhodococcus sp. B50 TaxID=2682847 RepID=UPI001BD612CA|nr:DUF3253 domain-containing protein [Rhodococcus sp. B50]MBS9373948.1 hypothetical protein [Rhodococcus sp. B50]